MRTRLHSYVLDHHNAPRELVPTGPSLRTLDSDPLPPIAASTPRKVIQWSLSFLPEDPGGFTFVDMGCGLGRVIYEAARLPFERVVGFESDHERYEAAMANLRAWPRSNMACRDIDIYHADLMHADLPEGDLVAYVYGLNDGRLMSFIASRLSRHARMGNKVYLIYADPEYHGFIEKSPTFTEVQSVTRNRLWLSLLSPFPVRFYRLNTGTLGDMVGAVDTP
jgi:SAM-dependent methyltransferase